MPNRYPTDWIMLSYLNIQNSVKTCIASGLWTASDFCLELCVSQSIIFMRNKSMYLISSYSTIQILLGDFNAKVGREQEKSNKIIWNIWT